ncbi:glutathione S-transferase family protein [Roseovarius sp. Pro17]|uniref:glutathione S-transferase family protein n=1 Tax=Roseovarius sp. Pro17 TaxID=3108175 RepID=UPI002D782522|nr:glutathione S-transferase family protein [Roseovarius sp. Pro17]
MGLLIDGRWHDQWYDTAKSGGKFERKESVFRNWVTPDGTPGPTGEGGHRAEAGRYHLYVSLACPWAHRTLIMRRLKGLEDAVSVSVVHWYMGENGWTFEDGPGVVPDPIHGAELLHQVYTAAVSDYTGRVTVPLLWDRQTKTIVSNESADILRMFNSAFDGVGARAGDYYPEQLRGEIDAVNAAVYEPINNGVYKAGFATTQDAYLSAVEPLFAALDDMEQRLAERRYLVANRLTEADIRLFTTLVRFDPVYVGHFKCNQRRLVDYPALWAYARDIFQMPGVSDTVDFNHIKRHYFESHPTVNPSGIVPIGPQIDFTAAHDRGALGPAAFPSEAAA